MGGCIGVIGIYRGYMGMRGEVMENQLDVRAWQMERKLGSDSG